jgi:hypothetical protein
MILVIQSAEKGQVIHIAEILYFFICPKCCNLPVTEPINRRRIYVEEPHLTKG